VFFQTRPDTTSTFYAQNGRIGRGRTIGRVLVVFGRVFSLFNQDFMVFVKICWLLIQTKIIS
jgi:hypothetical protein